MFEVELIERGRGRWEWRVCDRAGKAVMRGLEDSRVDAKYRGERALFLLLSVSPRSEDPTKAPR